MRIFGATCQPFITSMNHPRWMTATTINTLGIDSRVVTVTEDSHRSWWFWQCCCGHFKDNSCRPWTMHGHSHIYPFWWLCRTRSLCLSKGKSMSLSKGNQSQVVWYVHTWMPNQQYSLKLKVCLCRLECLNFIYIDLFHLNLCGSLFPLWQLV